MAETTNQTYRYTWNFQALPSPAKQCELSDLCGEQA